MRRGLGCLILVLSLVPSFAHARTPEHAGIADGTIPITIDTDPPGRLIQIDHVTYVAPQTRDWVPGETHAIGANSPQTTSSARYTFAAWSDGAPRNHSIVVPVEATTYTVSFATTFPLSATVSPAGTGIIAASPASADGYYSPGTTVLLTASPIGDYGFDNWTGDATGSSNPITLTMDGRHSVIAHFATAVTVTFTTTPTGLPLTIDGATSNTPQSFAWIPGSSHSLTGDPPPPTVSRRYIFQDWSDGGSQSHSITTPGVNAAYAAHYLTQYTLTTVIAPLGAGTLNISPSSPDRFYDVGTAVELTATANPGHQFDRWTGAVEGSENPVVVSMDAVGAKRVTANFTGVSGVEGSGAARFLLSQNQPNPFREATRFSFSLPTRARASLRIYDVRGRLVQTLVDGMLGPGNHEVGWDGASAVSPVENGLYFAVLSGAGQSQSRRICVMR